MSTHTPAVEERDTSSIVKVVFASLVGTAVEWYDFFLYGSAAALVFPILFFPDSDPVVGTLLAFGAYAVGFVARPLGGIVFGHFGDRVGRKKMLVASLMLMGAVTFAIGLLPTYATIGVAAPILLLVCRLLQGFAVGGEWGGAVLMAAEHGDPERRGFWSSWPQAGVALGNLLAHRCPVRPGRAPERRRLRGMGMAHPVPAVRRTRPDRSLRAAADRGVAGLPGGQGRDCREEARVIAHAAARGGQDLSLGSAHRDGYADGREHLLSTSSPSS